MTHRTVLPILIDDYATNLKFLRDIHPETFIKYDKPNLDLGCGDRKEHWLENSVGIDMFAYGQEIVQDLCVTPWPLESNQFNRIRAQHILEHISDGMTFVNILNEVWRVGKPGGIFEGACPHFPSSPNFYRDPTHVRMINEFTFDAFLDGSQIHFGPGYGVQCKFRKAGRGIWINENRDVLWTLEIVK